MSVSEKVQGRHQDRLALVYVRQSTLRQVEQMQYALVERALQLGWARQRVEVIDDDLGRSGTTTANRPGFQRLMTEVGLGHVGLVLGVEMSRLARSCRDWHQLLEICALFDTLIADTDGVYDAGGFNDRLLLGLKGTISEAELHVLKTRMLEGQGRQSAARNCTWMTLPGPRCLAPPVQRPLSLPSGQRATLPSQSTVKSAKVNASPPLRLCQLTLGRPASAAWRSLRPSRNCMRVTKASRHGA